MSMPHGLSEEKVDGLVGDGLPGGVPIQDGPGPATLKNPGQPTAPVALPTVSYSEGAVATGTNYLPGQVFHETSSTSSAVINALAQPAPTPAPAPIEPQADDGKYSIVRTEYITSGNVVNMIIVKEAVEYVTVTTTTVLAAPKARRQAHVHRHGRHHRN